MNGKLERIALKTMRRMVAAFLFAAGAWQFAPPSLAAEEKYEVTVERGVAAKMRDGVTLRADIYPPKADGKFPVLLVRTPYDKTGILNFGLRAATRGYVVVAQDVRGRFTSEGEWYPFKNESLDGYDTVEWAAALPYSNGKVGMFGGSYVGATQYLAAIAKPPHLAGICPGDGFQLPRRMDVPRGSLRAVVQRVVVQRTGTGYDAASHRERHQPSGG